jgi:hypothetical protein
VAVELILFVLLSQIRPRKFKYKSVQGLKLKSTTQKFNGMDMFLSPLPNQSQKFKYTKCASFEAEIQDSKNSMEMCKRKKVEIAITYVHRPSHQNELLL